MAKKYSWPKRGTTSLDRQAAGSHRRTGQGHRRGEVHVTTSTSNKMLLARVLGCPHAHCKIKSIDVSPAEKVPGVVKAVVMKTAGNEVRWEGDPIAAVAGESEGAVAEGLKAIKVEYEPLDVFVKDEDLAAAEAAGRTGKGAKNTQLETRSARRMPTKKNSPTKRSPGCLKESDVVVEGLLRHRRDHAHVPRAARRHLPMGWRQAERLSVDAKRLGHGRPVRHAAGHHGRRRHGDLRFHRRRIRQQVSGRQFQRHGGQDRQGSRPAGEADARSRHRAENGRLPPERVYRRQGRRRQARRGQGLGFAPLGHVRGHGRRRRSGRDPLRLQSQESPPPGRP